MPRGLRWGFRCFFCRVLTGFFWLKKVYPKNLPCFLVTYPGIRIPNPGAWARHIPETSQIDEKRLRVCVRDHDTFQKHCISTRNRRDYARDHDTFQKRHISPRNSRGNICRQSCLRLTSEQDIFLQILKVAFLKFS